MAPDDDNGELSGATLLNGAGVFMIMCEEAVEKRIAAVTARFLSELPMIVRMF